MTTFVIVHGAFGSPAEMAPVIPELEALGHRASVVDLPSTDPTAMLDDYVGAVVDAVDDIEGQVVVVGHSAGGVTISLVPEQVHVDRLVYVAGIVPEPGQSIFDVVGDEATEAIMSVSLDDGNGCRSFNIELMASMVQPEERGAYIAILESTKRSQGWAVMEQPWPGKSLPDVACTYVLCTEDNTLPPPMQREMATRLGVDPLEISSEHLVFGLQPRELARLLVQ